MMLLDGKFYAVFSPEDIGKIHSGVWAYDDDLYQRLYEFFAPDMPVGTQKARTGDPDEFIFHKLEKMGFWNEQHQ